MAIPKNITIRRLISLVIALMKLHNFCTNESDEENDREMLSNWAVDTEVILKNKQGYTPVDMDKVHSVPVVVALNGAGKHFNNIPRKNHKKHENDNIVYPHELLHSHVLNYHKKRPTLRVQ